jgi:hypothetical protein
MTRISNVRAGVVLLPLLAVLAVGCSSDGGGDDELTLPTSGPTAEEAEEPAETEGELEALYRAYYSALVEMENADEVDPSLLDGITGDRVREEQVERIRQLKKAGVAIDGESVITHVTAELSGEEALVQGCVDTSGRTFYDAAGDELSVEQDGPDVSVVAAERTSDGWLITEDRGAEGATITC